MGRAAHHRHEEILDADVQSERRRVHETLQVRVEPAREARVQCGDEEDDGLGAGGIDAHALGHQAAALECTDGAPFARIEQVLRRQHGTEQDDPDEVVERAATVQRQAEQLDDGNPGQPGVSAEEGQVAKQKIQADAPGDRPQREIVAGQA